MKLFRSAPVRHLAAMLLAFVMLASVCSFPVFAASEAEDQQVSDELYSIEFIYNDEEREAAIAALLQKYPNRPDVVYEAVSHTYYEDPNEKLAAYEQVIQLAKRSSDAFYVIYHLRSMNVLLPCYEKMAEIYLKELYQQDKYIAAMRSALDVEEKEARKWFDADINWAGAVEDLQTIQAKRAELDAIERWYKSGSPANFTAWNGRVQVTVDAGNRAAHVQMQTLNGEDSDSIMLFSGESAETSNLEYFFISQDISCNAPYAQPISKVLRAIDEVYFAIPVQWEQYEQDPDASYASYSVTYYKKDGITPIKSADRLTAATIGFARDFFDMRDLSLPADIRRFMETECSEEWNAGGLEDSGRICYSAGTIAL